MSRISQLTAVSALSSADQIPLSSADSGDDVRMSLALLKTYMQANLTFTGGSLSGQYSVPTTGATVTILAADAWLIVTPAGTLAALTVALPSVKNAGQEVLVVSSQIITALTLSGSGTTVIGAPTAMTAGGFFRMKYDAVLAVWFRVG